MNARKTVSLFLLGVPIAVLSAEPMTGVDSAQASQGLLSFCAKDSSCTSQSIVAIPNRLGDAATCVQSSVENKRVAMGGRLYYIYSYKNVCSFDAWVNLRIQNKWDTEVGSIKKGADVTVSVMYESGSGQQPTSIMLCKSSNGPKDESTCK